MTKYQSMLYSNYVNSNYSDSLYSAYEKPSRAKLRVLDDCRAFQYEMQGYDGKICTRNSFMFTYAFRYDDIDPETGELHNYVAYITPSKIEFIEL